MCSCHSILECCVMFSGVKLSMRSFVFFLGYVKENSDRIKIHLHKCTLVTNGKH